MKRAIVIIAVILVSLVASPQATAQVSKPGVSACRTDLLVSLPDFPTVAAASSPAASPTGSPEATPVQETIPAGDDIAAELEKVAHSLAACISTGDTAAVGELTTAEYRGDLYGGGERLSLEDYLAIMTFGPVVQTTVLSVEDASFDGMLTVSADVQVVRGNQLFHERWTFLYRDATAASGTPVAANQGVWRAHRIAQLEVNEPQGADRVEVILDEYVIRLQNSRIDSPNVILSGENEGSEPHEMLVLQLSDSADVEDLLLPSADGFPAGITIIGELTLLPGESGDMILVDLEPGEYVVVCLLPDSFGVPHLSFGQTATFTVS